MSCHNGGADCINVSQFVPAVNVIAIASGAGLAGGQIVFAGKPSKLAQSGTPTGIVSDTRIVNHDLCSKFGCGFGRGLS